MRFLRDRWPVVAILICVIAFVPLILGISQGNNQALVSLGVIIFMIGVLFALVSAVLGLFSSSARRR